MAHSGRRNADDMLVLAFACGATVESAARTAGVSERTVYRRRAEPGFQQRVNKVRAEMFQQTSGMLTAAGGQAVRRLVALLAPSASDADAFRAAKAILELGIKYRDKAELEARLAAVEQVLFAKNARRRG